MGEMEKSNFIAYEYKEIVAESGQSSFLLDGYENFGWELDERFQEHDAAGKSEKKTVIRLRRNRKILNKMELTRLQRNFEACVREIQTLEKSKTSLATIYALVMGIIGTAFMAGSTFAVVANPPHIILCILLAVPGFLGWILPYFVYKRLVWRQGEKIQPLIEAKYEEIYELCEKGNKLLF